jgi:hypothetical protein
LKTLVVLAVMLHATRAGRQVAIIDFENGPRATRRLLVDLGATDDELGSIYYVEPDGPPTAPDVESIVAALSSWLSSTRAWVPSMRRDWTTTSAKTSRRSRRSG